MSPLNIKIVLQDELSASWNVWFENLCVDRGEDHTTCLSGDVVDYPALYGLLERIRDLNLHLESVQVQSISQKGTNQ
jgi:hypothetical protein